MVLVSVTHTPHYWNFFFSSSSSYCSFTFVPNQIRIIKIIIKIALQRSHIYHFTFFGAGSGVTGDGTFVGNRGTVLDPAILLLLLWKKKVCFFFPMKGLEPSICSLGENRVIHFATSDIFLTNNSINYINLWGLILSHVNLR